MTTLCLAQRRRPTQPVPSRPRTLLRVTLCRAHSSIVVHSSKCRHKDCWPTACNRSPARFPSTRRRTASGSGRYRFRRRRSICSRRCNSARCGHGNTSTLQPTRPPFRHSVRKRPRHIRRFRLCSIRPAVSSRARIGSNLGRAQCAHYGSRAAIVFACKTSTRKDSGQFEEQAFESSVAIEQTEREKASFVCSMSNINCKRLSPEILHIFIAWNFRQMPIFAANHQRATALIRYTTHTHTLNPYRIVYQKHGMHQDFGRI